ncbi:MAG: hypothetical protein GEU71_00750 [Actinobacteria bacterium]|nr:hypothetical protein [Actinomycetota bacterium]
MTDKVRLASIGLGWWGNELASAAGRAGVEIVSCFARSAVARDRFAETHGCRTAESLESLLADADVEGVLIATPHSTRVSVIEAAAEAGKHIFVEKPMALTYRDGRASVDVADRAGVILQVGHNRRRQPAIRRIKSMIDGGEIGIVHHAMADLSYAKGQRPRPGWRGDPAESPAGGMTGLGVHMIDSLIYLFGDIQRLAAFSKQILQASLLDEITTIMLEFSSGPLGTIVISTVTPERAMVAVFGTEKAAWSEGDGTRFLVQSVAETTPTELPVEVADTLQEELTEFARCIRDGTRPEVGGAEGLKVVQTLEAVTRSVRDARIIELDEIAAG